MGGGRRDVLPSWAAAVAWVGFAAASIWGFMRTGRRRGSWDWRDVGAHRGFNGRCRRFRDWRLASRLLDGKLRGEEGGLAYTSVPWFFRLTEVRTELTGL